MYVEHRYELPTGLQASLKARTPHFGFNGLGETTFYRSYSRPVRDANEQIKKLKKDGGISEDDLKKFEADIQKITDKYIKETDKEENTLSLRQEIYNEKNELVEIHHKYPVDKGHQKLN